MAGNNTVDTDRRADAEIMHGIGKLTGAVQALQDGLTARINDIRQDIRHLDQANNQRMDRIEASLGAKISDQGEAINRRIDDVAGQVKSLEENVGKRIDGLGSRVTSLEAEDKRIIEKVAGMSALGGGVGGALVAGAVELLKHF